MPAKNAPKPPKKSKGERDYVGEFDGSGPKDKWMTRTVSTARKTKKHMVPNSSKPTEALKSLMDTQGSEAFDRRKYNSKGRKNIGGFGYDPSN